MKRRISLCALAIGMWISSGGWWATQSKYVIRGTAQGTTYTITYYSSVPLLTKEGADLLLKKMDEVFSLYRADSWVMRFNASLHGCKMDAQMEPVWQKAMEVYRTTEGIGDISLYALTQKLKGDDSRITGRSLRRLRSVSGMHLLYQKGDSLLKVRTGVQLDTDGIAQGYTVDRLSEWIAKQGIRSYVVELGGEVRVLGCKPDSKEKMRIAIEAPYLPESGTPISSKYLFMSEGAITSSGNYRKYLATGGRVGSHIIDPRTGHPVRNELISVSVYAPDALTADAYDHAVFAMGLDKGLRFVDAHPSLAAYFIYRDHDGRVRDTASRSFRSLMNETSHCLN